MVRRALVLGWCALALTAPAAAQTLGTFRWQLEPYCNIVSVTVVQQGGHYLLDGTDDQCGGGARSSVNGLAFLNADGSIAFGLTLVAPTSTPVHIAATMSLATLSGGWQAGALFGPFTFTPGAGSGGALLPLIGGTISEIVAGVGLTGGGSAGPVTLHVDYTTTQRRIASACPSGTVMAGVSESGAPTCVPNLAGGDITAVTASTGLFGGGIFGDVMLGVNFGGTGTADTVARSDHHHTDAQRNVSIGPNALVPNAGQDNIALGNDAMRFNATGGGNVAIGSFSLRFGTASARNVAIGHTALESTTGTDNTAVGYFAGRLNTTGSGNVAVGRNAMTVNTTGAANTSVGQSSLDANVDGSNNTAMGSAALGSNTSGSNNVALGAGSLGEVGPGSDNIGIGFQAGLGLFNGSNNILIGANVGTSSLGESNTIRIGNAGATATFIRGIHTATSSGGIGVFVNANGQLGTATSSARFKEQHRALSATPCMPACRRCAPSASSTNRSSTTGRDRCSTDSSPRRWPRRSPSCW